MSVRAEVPVMNGDGFRVLIVGCPADKPSLLKAQIQSTTATKKRCERQLSHGYDYPCNFVKFLRGSKPPRTQQISTIHLLKFELSQYLGAF
jgi:hypothetical protein